MLQKHDEKAMTPMPMGVALLQDPALNKGTAFTETERDRLHLRGLLPSHVSTQEQQLGRVLENFRRKSSDLEKYINLRALHDRNETLFFRLLIENPDEMMPIVYTPTVGLACQRYTHIFQRPHGIFVSATDRGRVADVLANWPRRHDVRIIVVSDGERILGLGDLGANGMGIPVGKLSLYTACAGVHPSACLPVLLDAGTNNSELLDDPLYIGLHQPRVRGEAYDALVEEFVVAATELFPGVVIQFEDFASHNAFRLLRKYRDRIPTFNDDIQGTAAVTLAGILSALRVTGGALGEQTLLFQGAGEAATGIADLVVEAMVAKGLTNAQARSRCWLFDSKGLVVGSRNDLAEHKRPYAHDHAPVGTLLDAVKALRPTAIIGVAAVGGAFTEDVVRDDGFAQQAAHRVRAVQSNVESRMHGDPGVPLVGRPRAVRVRLPVRPGHARRADPRSAAGQQLVHLPRRRPGRDRVRREPCHRRDVHGGGERARRTGPRRRSAAGKPVPAAFEHSRRFGAHRRSDRRRRLSQRSRARRRAGEPAGGGTRADVRTPLLHLRDRLKTIRRDWKPTHPRERYRR